MKIYIAGPMRGYPNFNFPAFDAVADYYKRAGYEVFNPADKDREKHGKDFETKYPTGAIEEAEKDGFSLREALKKDLGWICEHATAVYMLPGWEKSFGAKAEHATAVALGLDIYYG